MCCKAATLVDLSPPNSWLKLQIVFVHNGAVLCQLRKSPTLSSLKWIVTSVVIWNGEMSAWHEQRRRRVWMWLSSAVTIAIRWCRVVVDECIQLLSNNCSCEHTREFPCCWKQLLATGSCKPGKKKGWKPLNNLGTAFFGAVAGVCVASYVSRVTPHHFSSTVQSCTRALAHLPARMAAENGLSISESAWTACACCKSTISRK